MRRLALGLAVCLIACAGGQVAPPPPAPLPPDVQAVSLLGDTLRTFPLPAPTRTRYEQQLAEARAAYDRAPTEPAAK